MSVANKFFAIRRPKITSGPSNTSGKPHEVNWDSTEFTNGDLLFITKEELYRLHDIEKKYTAMQYRLALLEEKDARRKRYKNDSY